MLQMSISGLMRTIRLCSGNVTIYIQCDLHHWKMNRKIIPLIHSILSFSSQPSIHHQKEYAPRVHHCANNAIQRTPINVPAVLLANFSLSINAFLQTNVQWAHMQTAQVKNVKVAQLDVLHAAMLLT